MSHPARLETADQALAFIFAGNARVTLVSRKSQKRYTFKVRVSDDRLNMWFISLLTGPDNSHDYEYLGHRYGTGLPMRQKGKPDHPAFSAFVWAIAHMRKGHIPPDLEVWHEGRCGRCARTLTVPESIASGFGPECVKQRKAA